jgi:hypothetical protein
MKQSKTVSAIEATLNIGSGFIISVLVWQVLAGWYGYPMPLSRNLEITSIFTVVSVLRSYIWRRAFVAHLDRFLHRRLGAGYDK